jgi:hypothetical protein
MVAPGRGHVLGGGLRALLEPPIHEGVRWPSRDRIARRVPRGNQSKPTVLWLLKGERVVALTATGARLSGGLMFYRRDR